MWKRNVFVKQVENNLGDLGKLHCLNEEKAKAKETRCSAVDDWKRVLKKHLEFPSTLPSVIKGDFQDAQKLFKPGKNGQVEAAVTLRRKSMFSFWQKRKPIQDEIVLPQFDPNLKSNAVVCRHPTCKNKNPDAPKRGTCGIKRDLYLCPNHRALLESRICDAMAEEGIEFHKDEFVSEPGRFEGYTSLISLFDEASRESKNENVRAAALNTRNFLIITSTLLNPDDRNLSVALPAVAAVTGRIVASEGRVADNPEASVSAPAANVEQHNVTEAATPNTERVERTFRETIGDSERVQNLLSLLRGIIDIILFAFGVLYSWIVPSNIGGKIGAGIGGSIGLVGFAVGPSGGAIGVTLGATFGGLIGSGVYDLVREWSNDRARREWLAAGNDGGDPDDGSQPQGMYQCTIHDNFWDLSMYINLSNAWLDAHALL